MILNIEPGSGIGPIKIGMTREQVLSVLGESNHSGSGKNSEQYFDFSIDVEFTDNKVTFIGVSQSKNYSLIYRGINVFDLEAECVFDLISKHEPEKHEFSDSQYVFPDQIITLWDADEQYDRLGDEQRKIWAQIGLGSNEYLQAIQRITRR